MNKNAILKYLNVLLGLCFIIQAGTGGWLRIAPNHFAAELHELFGPIFVIVVLLHLSLNFGWVKTTYLKKKK